MKTNNVFLSTLAALLLISGCATPVAIPIPTESPTPPTITSAATGSPTQVLPDPTEPISANTHYQIIKLAMIDALNGTANLMDPENKWVLAVTKDGWQTWRDITPPNATAVPSTYFFDDQTGFALIFPNEGSTSLWKTEDGGEHWIGSANYPANYGAEITFLSDRFGLSKEVDGGAGHAYIKYYETADGGDHWSLLPLLPPDPSEGLPEGVIDLCNICQDLIEQTEMDTLIVYGEMANEPAAAIKIAVSNDRGLNWTRTEIPKPKDLTSAMSAPISALLTPDKWIVALGLSTYNSEPRTKLIFLESQDQGNTWEMNDPKITLATIPPTQIKFLGSSFAYFPDLANIFWIKLETQQVETTPISDQFPKVDLSMMSAPLVEFVDRENGWLIFNFDQTSTLYHTNDGGVHWVEIMPARVTQP